MCEYGHGCRRLCGVVCVCEGRPCALHGDVMVVKCSVCLEGRRRVSGWICMECVWEGGCGVDHSVCRTRPKTGRLCDGEVFLHDVTGCTHVMRRIHACPVHFREEGVGEGVEVIVHAALGRRSCRDATG
jgi:hypothetical protein